MNPVTRWTTLVSCDDLPPWPIADDPRVRWSQIQGAMCALGDGVARWIVRIGPGSTGEIVVCAAHAAELLE